MLTVFALLLAYQVKHFLCDFPLQTEYMLGKFKDKGWVLPLVTHAWIHFLGTHLIVSLFTGDVIFAGKCALFDFVIHFCMDRIKASSKLMGRWKPLTAGEFVKMKGMLNESPFDFESFIDDFEARGRLQGNRLFWWALGIDQMVHHLTHYAIIYAIVTR